MQLSASILATASLSTSGLHKRFAIAGRITFIFINCVSQCVQGTIVSVLLPDTKPSLLSQVFFAAFVLSIRYGSPCMPP